MSTQKSAAVLNSLLKVNGERTKIFETAKRATKENDLKMLFSEFINLLENFNNDLEKSIIELNGIPLNLNSRNNVLSRFYSNVKSAFEHNSREDLLNMLEYDEFVAMNKYRQSLSDNLNDLDYELHSYLKTHLSMLQDRHDRIKELGDQMLTSHNYDKSFTF